MSGGHDPDDHGSGGARRLDDLAEAEDPVVGAVALLVLGAGLGSLFGIPVLNAVDFWVIFVIGYAVVVPLVSLFRGRRAELAARVRTADDAPEESDDVDAALDRLRDRYASGELSEAQFERKLEALLETETPEDARERLDRRAGVDGTEAARESERERSG